MRKILESCPSCDGPLEIAEVHCLRCGTRVQAHYRPCDFCRLTEEQGTFLKTFLTSRGNLSEVEKRLGVSYPTVRAKLDEVISRLEGDSFAGDLDPPAPPARTRRTAQSQSQSQAPGGTQSQSQTQDGTDPPVRQVDGDGSTPPSARDRRAVLDAVSRGQLTASDALDLLRSAAVPRQNTSDAT